MKKNRIIWVCIFIMLILNCLISLDFSGISLLLVFGCVSAISMAYTYFTAGTIEGLVQLAHGARKGESIEGYLYLKTLNGLPVFKTELTLEIKNCRTGECEHIKVDTSLIGKSYEEIPFELSINHTGYVKVGILNAVVYDALGLLKKEVGVKGERKICILPDTFDMEIELVSNLMSTNDSIEYSKDKAGNDASELFGIREYIPGDSIKNIHWKISSKCDDIMVKLPSLPLENSILLLVENGYVPKSTPTSNSIDAVTEAFITVGQTLLDNSINYQVGWYDYEHKRMFIYDVETENDLHSVMGRILETSMNEDSSNVGIRYVEELMGFDKAHLVYFGTSYSGALEEITSDITSTAIICGDSNCTLPEGINTYMCTAFDYEKELAHIQI